jgi:hypothetical protein
MSDEIKKDSYSAESIQALGGNGARSDASIHVYR